MHDARVGLRKGRCFVAAEMKPGWKTTEFLVTMVIVVLGALGSAGVLVEGSTAFKIASFVGLVLGGLGYTGVRGSLKKIEAVKNGSPEDDS